MLLTVLDALSPAPIAAIVAEILAELGTIRAVHRLADERFGPCEGCFECWVAHPGSCKSQDDGNRVMRDIVAADELLFLVQPRFGAWDSLAKRALDKQLALVLPFFSTVNGETHHKPRYPSVPRLGAIAVLPADAPEAQRERFRLLVARNALNLQSAGAWVAFVEPDADRDTVRAAVRAARAAPLPPAPAVEPPGVLPGARGVVPLANGRRRRVLLLVGSPRPPGESASEHLGRGLLERLGHRGWDTGVAWLPRLVKLPRHDAPDLVEALAGADLVVFATPVYFDALPALVLAGLERLAPAAGPAPVLLPLVQCGFPEVAHTALAVEVLADAAGALGWGWAGHLAVGGGGALVQAPLDEVAGVARNQVAALEAAAAEIDAGAPLSAETIRRFAEPGMPAMMYRLVGDVGWVVGAWRHGATTSLADRPFARE